MIKYEKSIYSQNGEDGIIEHIFSKIGTTNKVAVEFGVSQGPSTTENNTRYLADLGWKLFWFDMLKMKKPVKNCQFKQIKLTLENIEEEFRQTNIPTEFDLLCIDIDGNDYHIREKLNKYKPRVCVMEYNGTKLSNEEYIMPYNEDYRWKGWRDDRFGASLLSITKLLDRLGYDLVYVEQNGVNAFYVRKDINVFDKQSVNTSWRPVAWLKKNENKIL